MSGFAKRCIGWKTEVQAYCSQFSSSSDFVISFHNMGVGSAGGSGFAGTICQRCPTCWWKFMCGRSDAGAALKPPNSEDLFNGPEMTAAPHIPPMWSNEAALFSAAPARNLSRFDPLSSFDPHLICGRKPPLESPSASLTRAPLHVPGF